MLRRVTARELAKFGSSVGHGEPFALSDEDKVQVLKAHFYDLLDGAFSKDLNGKIQAIRRFLQKGKAKGLHKLALQELLEDLEHQRASSGEGAVSVLLEMVFSLSANLLLLRQSSSARTPPNRGG